MKQKAVRAWAIKCYGRIDLGWIKRRASGLPFLCDGEKIVSVEIRELPPTARAVKKRRKEGK